jgi:hypothetical protein
VTTPPFRNDAGFYETPYGSFRSVTTIIDLGVPKGEVLRRWAASETAKSAFERLPYLIGASRDEEERKHAMTWLRNASERKRNQAADLGTAIHNAAEARVLGTPWPDRRRRKRPSCGRGTTSAATGSPSGEAVELVVANPDEGYAGKTDWHAYVNIPDVGRVLCIGDYKTGKNIYPEIGLQLAAYRRAKVAWLRDGTEVVPPRADYAVGIHLRPDRYKRTGYRVLPVRTDDVVFEAFRHAIHVANFTADIAPTVVGKAISPAA